MFVGRSDELAVVRDAIETPDCALAVIGEAGIGKTRLVIEAADRAARPLLTGGALASLAWMSYAPLRRALGESLTAPGWRDDPESAAARIEHALGDRTLFIDDLQWADTGTREALALLIGRVSFVATVRTGEQRSATALEFLTAAGCSALELAPLDAVAAIELARGVRADSHPAGVEAAAARAGGNPLLIEELVIGGEHVQSLELALAARLRGVPGDAVRELRLLALAERPLPIEHITRSELLAQAGLVTVTGRNAEIRHALLAEVVADDIPDDARRELHRELGRLLEHPGDTARHLLLGGERERGLKAALQAVEVATTPGERARQLLTAAQCAGDDAESELLLGAASAAVQAGEHDEAEKILAMLTGGDAALRTQTAVLHATSCRERGDRDGWMRWAEEAVALAPSGTAADALALAEHARAVLLTGQKPGEALALAQRAYQVAEACGAHRGRSLYVLGSARYFAADPHWQSDLERAREFAREEDDLLIELVAANNLVVAHESSGSPNEGARIAEEMMVRSRELQLERWRRHFAAARINLAMHAGELARVDVESARLLAQPLMPRTRAGVASAWAMVLVDLARFDDALVVADDHLVGSMFASNAHHIRAAVSAATGDPRSALAELPAFVEKAENEHLLTLAAPLFHWAAFRAGVDEPELLESGAVSEIPMLAGVAHELDAVRALRREDRGTAIDELVTAAVLWAPYHRRGQLRCLVEAAALHVDDALAAGGDAEVHAVAVERLQDVERQATQLGMVTELMRIARLQRKIGITTPRRTPPASGSLTERERQVLRFVLQGFSDAAIGARLGISPRTVETHVQSARGKLGASNRDQAAALAAAE